MNGTTWAPKPINFTVKPQDWTNSTSLIKTWTNMTNSTLHPLDFTNITMDVLNWSRKSNVSLGPDQNEGLKHQLFHRLFNLYLILVIVVIGLVGNGMVMVIMQNKVFKNLPLSVYFCAIAASDSLMLVMGTTRQFMKQLMGINLYTVAKYCASLGYITNIGNMLSGWFVVCLAAERMLVVLFPLKAKQLTSKNKAIVTVTIMTGASVILNSFNLWMPDFSTPACNYKPQFNSFKRFGKSLFLLVGYNLLPLLITAVCYVMVVVGVKKKTLMRQSGQQRHERLTATALYICLSFLVFTSPTFIFIFLQRTHNWIYKMPENIRVFETLVFFFRQFNYSMNFVIYLASSRQFRKAFRSMLGCQQEVAPTTST